MANKFKLYAICSSEPGNYYVYERYMLENEVIDWLTNRLSVVISKHWKNLLDKSKFDAGDYITVISEVHYDDSKWNNLASIKQ